MVSFTDLMDHVQMILFFPERVRYQKKNPKIHSLNALKKRCISSFKRLLDLSSCARCQQNSGNMTDLCGFCSLKPLKTLKGQEVLNGWVYGVLGSVEPLRTVLLEPQEGEAKSKKAS